MDPYNSIAVYDWKSSRMIASNHVDAGGVNSIAWKDPQTLVTVGNSHIKFWEIHGHSMIASRKEKIIVPLYKVIFL